MTIELQMLLFSIVLGVLHHVPKMSIYTPSYYKWASGPRDDPGPPLTRVLERVERAYRNYMETFPFFMAAVLTAHVTDTHSWMTVWGVHLYFWGRLAYLPLYAFGIRFVRSQVWNVATAGIALIVVAMI